MNVSSEDEAVSSDWDSADWDSDSMSNVAEQVTNLFFSHVASTTATGQRDEFRHDPVMQRMPRQYTAGRPSTLQSNGIQARSLNTPNSFSPQGLTFVPTSRNHVDGGARVAGPYAWGASQTSGGRTASAVLEEPLRAARKIPSVVGSTHSGDRKPFGQGELMQTYNSGTGQNMTPPLADWVVNEQRNTGSPQDATGIPRIKSGPPESQTRWTAASLAPEQPTYLIGPGPGISCGDSRMPSNNSRSFAMGKPLQQVSSKTEQLQKLRSRETTRTSERTEDPETHESERVASQSNVRARVIKASEVGRFIGLNAMSDIIRQLYLPRDVRRWQQLVRVAVLTVGQVEEWHIQQADSPSRQGSTAVSMPTFANWQEWINEWLELQPLSRFRGAQPFIHHPSALLYPEETHPSDWSLFWLHARQIVFKVLLGFKTCSPHHTGATDRSCSMERAQWAAWLEDILWVFYELLNHMDVHGKALLQPYVKLSNVSSLFVGSNADPVGAVSKASPVLGQSVQPGPLLLPVSSSEHLSCVQSKKRSLDEEEAARASGSGSKRPRAADQRTETTNKSRQEEQSNDQSSPQEVETAGKNDDETEL
ncbi:hypothetical protein L227DRAFT_568555 [Lentinus tigrinus ALCF2SS1-6]|uniref:Uncharacterized protein n=1 Tax=Lentinus tigrinus ALCF2SS1-6 TaxID=1328759 RepID=A0A5C2RPR1_9APHY|nr:hypothetical protein L227DRAFT_568555 [Lentinus tigrinus ALCF2SS1-6]